MSVYETVVNGNAKNFERSVCTLKKKVTKHTDIPGEEKEDHKLIMSASDFILEKTGYDPRKYNCQTFSQLGMDLFRIMYFNREVHKYKTNEAGVKLLDGDLQIQARKLSLICNSSGRNDSTVAGVVEDVEMWDVDSMYPASLILQPLPNAETEWHVINCADQIEGMEGFVTVEFESERGDMYPNLPARFTKEKEERTCFPLAGSSVCTIAEVNYAKSVGMKIGKISGVGFVPGESEINHDMVEFCKLIMGFKKTCAKGTPEREVWKGIINMGLGRLFQQSNIFGKAKPGSMFIPEWYSLMVGRARKIQSDLMRSSNALYGYTDSIVVRRGSSFDCESYRDLVSVGSGLSRELPEEAIFKLWTTGKPAEYAILDENFNVVKGGNYGGSSRRGKEEETKTSIENNERHKDMISRSVREGKLCDKSDLLRKTIGRSVFRSFGTKKKSKVNLFSGHVVLVPYQTTGKCAGAIEKEARSENKSKLEKSREYKVMKTMELVLEGRDTKDIQDHMVVSRSASFELIKEAKKRIAELNRDELTNEGK